jgi:hypothetical protein
MKPGSSASEIRRSWIMLSFIQARMKLRLFAGCSKRSQRRGTRRIDERRRTLCGTLKRDDRAQRSIWVFFSSVLVHMAPGMVGAAH